MRDHGNFIEALKFSYQWSQDNIPKPPTKSQQAKLKLKAIREDKQLKKENEKKVSNTDSLYEYYCHHVYPVTVNQAEECWVYVVYSELTRLTKIGITKDFSNRLSQLECQSGLVLEVVAGVLLGAGDEPAILAERALHDYYKDKRKRGEWFDLDNFDKEDIINLFCTVEGIETMIPSTELIKINE
tara:strand:- start:6119 stop:6673 length:555 start_codon:yes stop_codon:yes gene_type:complete